MVTVAPFRSSSSSQQQRNGGDLVGLGIDGDLAERQPGFAGPRRYQMQRIAAGGFVERAAQGLAIDGNMLADLASDIVQPLLDAVNQLGRIEQREHAAEGVVRGDAAFQLEKRPQPG